MMKSQGLCSQDTTDEAPAWPVTQVARGDLATEIAGIKAELGANVIVWCGARFAGALTAADLIDEYRPLIQPLVVGSGHVLFHHLPESRHLDLDEATPFPSGIFVQSHRPQRG